MINGNFLCLVSLTESRDGVVVIALASHLHSPGSGHRWVKLVACLYSARRGFSPGSLVFPSPKKSTSPNSNSIGCRTAPTLG